MAKNIRWSSGTTSSRESSSNAAQIRREIAASRSATTGRMVNKDSGKSGTSKPSK